MGEDWYFLMTLGVLMALVSFTMSFIVGRVVQGEPFPACTPALGPGLQSTWAWGCPRGCQVQRGWGGSLDPVLVLLLTCYVALGFSLLICIESKRDLNVPKSPFPLNSLLPSFLPPLLPSFPLPPRSQLRREGRALA